MLFVVFVLVYDHIDITGISPVLVLVLSSGAGLVDGSSLGL